MFVLGDLPRVAWHGKEEGRSQMIGWDPKNGSGTFFPSAKKGKDKVSCWTGFMVDGTKSQVLRVKEDEKNISDTKESFLQASIKNSIKSISP